MDEVRRVVDLRAGTRTVRASRGVILFVLLVSPSCGRLIGTDFDEVDHSQVGAAGSAASGAAGDASGGSAGSAGVGDAAGGGGGEEETGGSGGEVAGGAAGSSLGGTGGAGGGLTGGTPGTVSCDGEPCSIQDGGKCCIEDWPSLIFRCLDSTGSCSQTEDDTEVRCDGPEDCPPQQMCCGRKTGPNTGQYVTLACQDECVDDDEHVVVCGQFPEVCEHGICKDSGILTGFRMCL